MKTERFRSSETLCLYSIIGFACAGAFAVLLRNPDEAVPRQPEIIHYSGNFSVSARTRAEISSFFSS